jgi:general secretion pathway protein G
MAVPAQGSPYRTRLAGFTLIEIMVVVVILGILAALITPGIMQRIDDAEIARTRSDLRSIETALRLFRMDNKRYPTTAEGLRALIERPDASLVSYKADGYLDHGLAGDPWNHAYHYESPGTHGGAFDVYTLGDDDQEGGDGVNADRGNWNLRNGPSTN